jgi:hypothetical protein
VHESKVKESAKAPKGVGHCDLYTMADMKATTEAYTFDIVPRDGKFAVTVKSRISGGYDTTGKPTNSGYEWQFDSENNAKAWATEHAVRLNQHDDLIWG